MTSKAAAWAKLQEQMRFVDDEGDVLAAVWIEGEGADATAYVRLEKVDKLSPAEMVKLCRWGLETLEER